MSSEKGNPDKEQQLKAAGEYSPYTDKDFAEALEDGVMLDKLNLKFITFWSIIGIISVILLIIIAAQLYSYYSFQRAFNVSVASEYTQITRLSTQANERLSNVGVIDDEAGIYHIPVDSAFTLILDEYENR